MIAETIKQRIEEQIDGCTSVKVQTVDASSGKYAVAVVAAAFQGVPLIQRHRLINALFDAELKDGSIHALEISAKPPAVAPS